MDARVAKAMDVMLDQVDTGIDRQNEEIDRLRAEVEQLATGFKDQQASIEAAVALHEERREYCNTCGGKWPCLTVRALRP